MKAPPQPTLNPTRLSSYRSRAPRALLTWLVFVLIALMTSAAHAGTVEDCPDDEEWYGGTCLPKDEVAEKKAKAKEEKKKRQERWRKHKEREKEKARKEQEELERKLAEEKKLADERAEAARQKEALELQQFMLEIEKEEAARQAALREAEQAQQAEELERLRREQEAANARQQEQLRQMRLEMERQQALWEQERLEARRRADAEHERAMRAARERERQAIRQAERAEQEEETVYANRSSGADGRWAQLRWRGWGTPKLWLYTALVDPPMGSPSSPINIAAPLIPSFQWYQLERPSTAGGKRSTSITNINLIPMSLTIVTSPYIKFRLEAGLGFSVFVDDVADTTNVDLMGQVGLCVSGRFEQRGFWSMTNVEFRMLLNFGDRSDLGAGSGVDYYHLDAVLAFHFRFPIGHSIWLSLAPELRWLWMQDYSGTTQFESSSQFVGARAQLDLDLWSFALWYNRGVTGISGDYTPINLLGGQVGLNW